MAIRARASRSFARPARRAPPMRKLADAAQVHKFTGVCPSVAHAHPLGQGGRLWRAASLRRARWASRIGAINPNLFQDDDYKLGSLCNPDAEVRRQAIDHMLECIEIAKTVGSERHQPLARRRHQLPRPGRHPRPQAPPAGEPGTRSMPPCRANMRLLIEYKFFEPAFYHTDLGDWGMAYTCAIKLGDAAQVLVDLGHHPLGTNIEQIVALAARRGQAGRLPFQQQEVRRRRPDRRLDQPLRAVPDLSTSWSTASCDPQPVRHGRGLHD